MSDVAHGGHDLHRRVISQVLMALNADEDGLFILKGGTALMQCYGLDRFSEDIDLDARFANVGRERFFHAIDAVCTQHGYRWQKAKDTPVVQRAFIDYGQEGTPLKVELSRRAKQVDADQVTERNGITVYTISELCVLKSFAYVARDKIRDLFDLAFIAERYYDELDGPAQDALRRALEYKDLEQFDYLIRTQHDPLIDADMLADRFLKTMDKAGLLSSDSSSVADPPQSDMPR